MTLDQLLTPDRIFPRIKAADKAALFAELARRAGVALGHPPEPIAAGLAAREALGSTGIGAGFAVPHARLPGLSEPAGFFIRLERPIAFAAIDDRPVDLLFLLLSPPEAATAHLALLAAISRRIRDKTVANAVRQAGDVEQIRTALIATP
jgi:PTS system nitrogen regulatory IIA component